MNPNTARLAAVVALVSGIFCGTALADTMTGSLVFGGDPTNWYDPVPAVCCTISGSSNATANSPTVTLVGGTTATFGYQDFLNTDTAAFTAGQLDIENILGPDFGFGQGSASWTQTFTASKTGFFTGWTLSSSNFDPATLA